MNECSNQVTVHQSLLSEPLVLHDHSYCQSWNGDEDSSLGSCMDMSGFNGLFSDL